MLNRNFLVQSYFSNFRCTYIYHIYTPKFIIFIINNQTLNIQITMQLQATPNPIQDTREVMAFNFMIVLFSAMV